MQRVMMKSKIHRATVTHADLHYVGSITIDASLLQAANLLPNEQVDVVNVTNGARLSTYVIEGMANSGVIGINGAAARLAAPGDIIIIIGYGVVPEAELQAFRPSVVFVDSANSKLLANSDPIALPEDTQDLCAPPLSVVS